jgi:hypothetical protein
MPVLMGLWLLKERRSILLMMPRYVLLILTLTFTLLTGCVSEDAQGTVHAALTSAGCLRPCWEGIEPGRTTREEAATTLASLNINYEEMPNSPPENNFYTFDAMSPLDSTGFFSIAVLDNAVERIAMPANICISTLVEEYGPPPRVYEDRSGTADRLIYDQEGLIFEVNARNSAHISYAVLFADKSADAEREFYDLVNWDDIKDQYFGECEDSFSSR